MKAKGRSPFKYERSSLGKDSKETEVKEFLVQGEQDPTFKIVKEVVVRDLEEVQSKFKRAYDLLSSDQFGLKQYMPRTQFVIGENDKGEKTLFILQEEIKGEILSEIIDEIDDEDLLTQIDDLIDKALTMLQQTRDFEKKLPLAIPKNFFQDFQYVEVEPGHGVMPEVLNLNNIMIGKAPGDTANRVYLVDNHSVIVVSPSDMSDQVLGDLLNNFTPIIRKLEQSQSVKRYLDIRDNV